MLAWLCWMMTHTVGRYMEKSNKLETSILFGNVFGRTLYTATYGGCHVRVDTCESGLNLVPVLFKG
jgi:hypothetical protein